MSLFILKPSVPGLIGVRRDSHSAATSWVPSCEGEWLEWPGVGHPDAMEADTLTATALGGMQTSPPNLIPGKLS